MSKNKKKKKNKENKKKQYYLVRSGVIYWIIQKIQKHVYYIKVHEEVNRWWFIYEFNPKQMRVYTLPSLHIPHRRITTVSRYIVAMQWCFIIYSQGPRGRIPRPLYIHMQLPFWSCPQSYYTTILFSTVLQNSFSFSLFLFSQASREICLLFF